MSKKTQSTEASAETINVSLDTQVTNAAQEEKAAEPVKKRWVARHKGGTYFYSSCIVGKKNIFVTTEYLDLLANAFKLTEIRQDIKNLAYVIMPNHFYWVFRLSENQDDPIAIYRELKKEVSLQIVKNLCEEAKEGNKEYELIDLFKDNTRVKRSAPRKILWTFKQEAKTDTKIPRKYKIWDSNAKLFLLKDEEAVIRNLKFINDAPRRDRWQLVSDSKDYPYLYIAEEFQEKVDA